MQNPRPLLVIFIRETNKQETKCVKLYKNEILNSHEHFLITKDIVHQSGTVVSQLCQFLVKINLICWPISVWIPKATFSPGVGLLKHITEHELGLDRRDIKINILKTNSFAVFPNTVPRGSFACYDLFATEAGGTI